MQDIEVCGFPEMEGRGSCEGFIGGKEGCQWVHAGGRTGHSQWTDARRFDMQGSVEVGSQHQLNHWTGDKIRRSNEKIRNPAWNETFLALAQCFSFVSHLS